MQAYRPDRVVRSLTSLVSIVYFGAWVVAGFVVIVAPAVKLLAPSLAHDPSYGLEVPVTLPRVGAALVPQWHAAPPGIRLVKVTAEIMLPVRLVPIWVNVVLWAALLVFFALVLLFLHHLRALFRRVRQGIPFDAHNAARMSWLGALLLVLYVFYGGFEFWLSTWVVRTLESSDVPIGAALHIDVFVVFFALVLIGLAEVFRRGAALEEEQSLVV